MVVGYNSIIMDHWKINVTQNSVNLVDFTKDHLQ